MNAPATPAAGPGDTVTSVERLGFAKDQIVQELGFDDDTDDLLREAVEERIGAPVEDEDYTGEVDAFVLWWRADDGDLTDALVDLVGLLEEGGFVLLLTPRPEHGAAVEASEIEEAAGTAGLHSAGQFTLSPQWRCVKLVAPKGGVRR